MRENRFFPMADIDGHFFSILAHFVYFIDYQCFINVNKCFSHSSILL